MGRPKGKKNKAKEDFPASVGTERIELSKIEYERPKSNEPEYYDPTKEKGEPVIYEKAESETPKDVLKPGPKEKLFESPGGCIHVGPEDASSVLCKEEGIKIRPQRLGTGKNVR